MAYPVAFFEPQVRLARLLAERFDLALSETLLHYTTAAKALDVTDEEWSSVAPALLAADDLAATLHAAYEQRRHPDPRPTDTTFHGRPLFGCFSYAVRDGGIIRPHFVANDLPGLRPLGVERVAARRDELRRLFAHVRTHVPHATTVLGNSWLYNVAAYRRLFPAAYTARLPESDEGEFQFLARWGQCYDRTWHPRAAVCDTLFQRAEWLTDLAMLRHCFPHQILQPECSVAVFYAALGLDGGEDVSSAA
jgi:hypothetical protein